ncbi:hypothetical protein D5086_029926, partial [Populus alba]
MALWSRASTASSSVFNRLLQHPNNISSASAAFLLHFSTGIEKDEVFEVWLLKNGEEKWGWNWSPLHGHDELSVPENLDATMHLLFLACRGDVKGVEDLLNEGIDVNSIDLDGRTALHIAACEGHVEVVKLLLSRRANIDARDRWGSTACADAKYYGNVEVYNILKARGAKAPKTTRKTPMTVANPREIPEYELNPLELQVRKSDGITKGMFQVAKWNGTKVAVKILEKDRSADPESINAFKHELTLLEKVRHPNVIQFVGAVTQNLPMMIVAEYHSKGDLASYLLKKGRLSPSKVLRFGLDIARQMLEGVQPFHPKTPEEVVKLMCLEKKRPPFKIKARSYPPDLKELINECWHSEPVVRPTFSEIITRLDKVCCNCSKQGWWKDTFKLP